MLDTGDPDCADEFQDRPGCPQLEGALRAHAHGYQVAAMHSRHLDNADLSRKQKMPAMEKIVSDLRLVAGLIVT
jgi:hypothetical protein